MRAKKELLSMGWTIFTLSGGAIKAVAPIGSNKEDVIGLSWSNVKYKINKQY